MKPADSVLSSENPNSRVIFSVPHDGLLLEDFQVFPPRTKGVRVHDEHTAEIVRMVNGKNSVAGVVRGLLPREICDYNRSPEEAFEVFEVGAYYNLYHRTLGEYLRASVEKHGDAILLDIHSFWGVRRPSYDLILGSRGGTTTPDGLDQKALAHFSAQGLAVVIAKAGGRYSGGFTVGEYGGESTSALQIEISSALLMDMPAKYDKLTTSLRSFVLSLH